MGFVLLFPIDVRAFLRSLVSSGRLFTIGVGIFADRTRDFLSVAVATVFVFVVVVALVPLGIRVVVEKSTLVFGRVFRWEMRLVLTVLGLINAVDLDFTLLLLVVALDLCPGFIENASLCTCGMAGAILW